MVSTSVPAQGRDGRETQGAGPPIPYQTFLRMTFTESIKTGFSKFTDFSGRASRSEYGWFGLFLLLVLAALVLGLVVASRFTGARVPYGALVLLLVPLYLAGVSVQVRRLRDAGLSPWWTLASLIPYLGVLLALALTLLPSAGGQDRSETHPGSLSTLSMLMVSGWGVLTGGGALTGEPPRGRNWRPLIAGVLVAVTLLAIVLVAIRYRADPAQLPAPVASAVPPGEPSLILMDEAPSTRLYYDPSTVRITGPDRVSIQLVFDFAQARERDGVRFRSLKQNEVFDCAARSSSWITRFYMSEALGEGAAVLIEEGQGSLLEAGGSELSKQRLDAVCKLLPGVR